MTLHLNAAEDGGLRIVLYGLNFSPELTGIGKYTGEMATWLAARGHQVRVVTAPPYYPHWRIVPGYRGHRYCRETWSGAAIWRCPLWVPRRPTGAKRLVHLTSFTGSSVPVMVRQALWRPDVVMTVAPALLTAPTAWAASRLSGALTWLHVQDFEVDAAFELGLLRSAGVRWAALKAERWLLKCFDRVSTISPRMVERLVQKGVDHERAFLLPNWVDLAEIAPTDDSSYRRELRLARHTIVALYSGNMGQKQGLELVAHAARTLELHDQIVFVLCGDGAGRSELQRAGEGLRNIRWLPLQPADRLNALLNLADIHLLPQRADAADLVMPSKLNGMLASGKPVVATAVAGTQVAQVVDRFGIVVPPGDDTRFASAIVELAADPERRARLGRAAREYAVAHLDRNSVLQRFEVELVSLKRSRRPAGAGAAGSETPS